MRPLRLARLSRPLSLALSLLLCLAPSALAKRVLAPPGNSGVEQYVEVVPGPEGNEPVGSQRPNKRVLTPSQRRLLQEHGAEGRALQAFAEATGTPSRPRRSAAALSRQARRPPAKRSRARIGTPSTGPSSPQGGLAGARRSAPLAQASATGSSGGLGLGLPIALSAIALLGLLGYLVRRRAKSG